MVSSNKAHIGELIPPASWRSSSDLAKNCLLTDLYSGSSPRISPTGSSYAVSKYRSISSLSIYIFRPYERINFFRPSESITQNSVAAKANTSNARKAAIPMHSRMKRAVQSLCAMLITTPMAMQRNNRLKAKQAQCVSRFPSMPINFTIIQMGSTISFNKNFMVTPLFLTLFYPIHISMAMMSTTYIRLWRKIAIALLYI